MRRPQRSKCHRPKGARRSRCLREQAAEAKLRAGSSARGTLPRVTARQIWQRVHERFDPQQPAQTSALRVDRDESPAKVICEALDLPFGIPRVMLTGTIGTGKTTELFRVADDRRSKELVIFLQIDRHFQETVGDIAALHTVSPWEVCFLAGLAILRAAEAIGFELPESHRRELGQAWQAAARASGAEDVPAQVDVAKLAKQVVVLASTTVGGPVGAGLQVLGAVAEAGRWSLSFGRRPKPLYDSDQRARTVLQCVNTLIGLVQQHARPVLLVLDGLDRLKDVARAKDLFVDSQMISGLDCRLVVCGPFALRHSQYAAAVSSSFAQVVPLVNLPVLQHDNPSTPGPGIDFFRALFHRRVADLGAGAKGLVPPHLLDKLAYYGGGRARSFVTMIRRLSEVAYIADVAEATEPLVDRVLQERRLHQETGLHRGHLRVLQAIADDPQHALVEDSLVEELLVSGSLLPFPNNSEWYYPNPLLMMHMVKPSAGPTKLA
jgi:hypothetical protein